MLKMKISQIIKLQTKKHLILSFPIHYFSLMTKSNKKKEMSDFNKYFLQQDEKIPDIISTKNIYSKFNTSDLDEFDTILNLLNNVNLQFDLEKFKKIIDFVEDNSVDDVYVYKIIENVILKNLNLIDYETKAVTVFMLGRNIYRKKLKLNEDNWSLIFFDFVNISENLSFASLYNYVVTFEKIKNRLHNIFSEIDKFLENNNVKLLNTGKIKLETIDDLVLLSGLIHNRTISIRNMSSNLWIDINEIVCRNERDININNILVLTSLFITYFENNSDTSAILKLEKCLIVINKYLDLLYSNYELFEKKEIKNMMEFSDTILYYYSHLYPVISSHTFYTFNESFIINLINNYKHKLEKNNFSFFQEVRILVLIGKDLKYLDKDFWNIASRCISEWLEVKFIKMLGEFTSRRLTNSNMKEEDMLILDLSYFFFGVILDTFVSVEYKEIEFWRNFFSKMEEFTNFSKKDILTVLKFISTNSRKFMSENFSEIWEIFTENFENNTKLILRNKELVDYLIKVNFHHYEIEIEEFNKYIASLFIEFNSNHISIYLIIMKLTENFIFLDKNEKCLQIMINILIDLNKMEKNSPSNNLLQKNYFEKLPDSNTFKIKNLIFKRISNNDLFKENEISFITYNMTVSSIIHKIDSFKIKNMFKI